MLKIESAVLLPVYATNTWLLYDDSSHEALIIDPSAPSPDFRKRIESLGLKPKMVINTHGHGDHIGGNSYFADAYGIPVAIHAEDAPMLTDNRKNMSEYMGIALRLDSPEVILNDGDIIELGIYKVKVIHTPGHTPGGICLLAEKYLISGDTLFQQSIGRTDLPRGSHSQIISSIKDKLYRLDDDTLVFPGHGPTTAIGLEKANNPFVRWEIR